AGAPAAFARTGENCGDRRAPAPPAPGRSCRRAANAPQPARGRGCVSLAWETSLLAGSITYYPKAVNAHKITSDTAKNVHKSQMKAPKNTETYRTFRIIEAYEARQEDTLCGKRRSSAPSARPATM